MSSEAPETTEPRVCGVAAASTAEAPGTDAVAEGQEGEGGVEEEAGEGEEGEDGEEDPEIAALQQRISHAQHEFEKITALHKQVEEQGMFRGGAAAGGAAGSGPPSGKSQQDIDNRSVYVGQVDYSATAAELQVHFQSCGTINRVTIAADKFTNHPRGYAYIEFEEEPSVANALLLNDTVFKGRQLKVTSKRTNIPAFVRGVGRGGFPRGRAMMAPMPMRGGRGFGPWRGPPARARAPRGYGGFGYY